MDGGRVSDDDSTLPIAERSDTLQSSLELHAGGQILPFHRSAQEWGGIHFTLRNGEVSFRALGDQPLYKEGVAVRSGRLEVGNYLESAGGRVLLWDHGTPCAYLKGYSHRYAGEIWPLPAGEHAVGRGGKRINSILLDDPTVSREHATFVCDEGGHSLKAESTVNPVCVGGTAVEVGKSVRLQPGDLIELGELVFRFFRPDSTPAPTGGLRARSLGSFQVEVEGVLVAEKSWKSQSIKWLLARLVYEWGRPIAAETLIEGLWPDVAPEKGRNNLNYNLSSLRTLFRPLLPERELFLRGSASVQLNPDVLDTHDLIQVQRLLKQGEAEAAVLAYSGPFLRDCFMEWAQPVRMTMELEILEAARTLLDARAAREEWTGIGPVARHVLKFEPCAQWACLRLLEAMRHEGGSAEALKVYEQFRKVLRKELDVEPDLDLLREREKLLAGL